MTDNFIELLVKRRATLGTKMKKAALIVLTLVLIVVTLRFFPSALLLVAALMIGLDVFLFGRMNIEYEYVFYEGELQIDRIVNKASRKKIMAVDVKEVDVIAPTNAQELLGYQHLKMKDYSTCQPENKTYEFVIKEGSDKVRVRFEPNEKMLNAMKNIAPRKVIL